MKVGDKVYCFKNILDLKKNTWYTIGDILLTVIDTKKYRYCTINNFVFFIDSIEHSSYNFKDYFTNLKEERRQKLLKIGQ